MYFNLDVNSLLTTLVGAGVLWLIRTVGKLNEANAADATWKLMHQASDDKALSDIKQDIVAIREAIRN